MAVDTIARALAIRAGTISLDYDPATKQMSFKDAQGNIITIPLVDFIDIYTGGTTNEIETVVESGNIIKSTLVNSSIGMPKLSLSLQNLIKDLNTPTFTQAKLKENIISGEALSVIFGKIMKWFSELNSAIYNINIDTAWSGASAPYTQTLSINGVTSTNIIEISPSANITEFQLKEMSNLILSDGGQTTNGITLKCFGNKNTNPIPITVIVRGDKD